MIYLLAKYTLLFLLTAALGFVLGYWFSRRNFEDVSESYEDLRKANARSDDKQWSRLWDQLAALPKPRETDLTGVIQGIDSVQKAVGGIPAPKAVNLEPIESRLDALAEKIRNIPAPKPADLKPIESRLDALTESVRNIPAPPAPVDIAPVRTQIDAVRSAVAAIPQPEATDLQPLESRLDSLVETVRNMPRPPTPIPVDLEPLRKELRSLREDIGRIPVVETGAGVDLSPITTSIDLVRNQLKAFPRQQSVDLQPIDRRLTAIEKELERVGKRVASIGRAPLRAAAPPRPIREQPRVLSAALYGKKDDLKLISGVGPKLEGLLNKNGVYYFWQVAEWNRRDIDIIDDRLDAFKGRILRDNWVDQARQLREQPSAARMPDDI